MPERTVANRIALVGDASHRVHPLAGLGVNLGFGDAECLTRKLEENVMQGAEFGSYLSLCEYETERARHNLPAALTIDGIQRLYSTNFDPVSKTHFYKISPLKVSWKLILFSNHLQIVLARSVGTQIVNGIPVLKKTIMSSASS